MTPLYIFSRHQNRRYSNFNNFLNDLNLKSNTLLISMMEVKYNDISGYLILKIFLVIQWKPPSDKNKI